MAFREAEQTLFASFSGKRRILLYKLPVITLIVCFSARLGINWLFSLGATIPWVGFAEGWVSNGLPRSGTNAFCFFFRKKKKLLDKVLYF
jgi:hypothetical protein